MMFAKEIMQLKERVAELETENAELKHVEEWKTIGYGAKYRRVGNDVEIKVAYNNELIFTSWEMKEIGKIDINYLYVENTVFALNIKTGNSFDLIHLNIQPDR